MKYCNLVRITSKGYTAIVEVIPDNHPAKSGEFVFSIGFGVERKVDRGTNDGRDVIVIV